MKKKEKVPIKPMYIELFIYFIISLIIVGWGWGAILTIIDGDLQRYNFLFNFYLIGIFASAIFHMQKNKELKFLSEIIFIGSIIAIMSLGLQGMYYHPKLKFIKIFSENIFPWFCTLGSIIMFTGLIGIGFKTIKKTIFKLRKGEY